MLKLATVSESERAAARRIPLMCILLYIKNFGVDSFGRLGQKGFFIKRLHVDFPKHTHASDGFCR